MVSFVSRGMVNKVIRFSPSIISPRELFTSHLFSSRFLSPARIMMLDMLTSCFSFLIDVARSSIDLAISSDDLSDGRLFAPMIRTMFYVTVLACFFFAPKKVLANTLQFAFNCLDISNPLSWFVWLKLIWLEQQKTKFLPIILAKKLKPVLFRDIKCIWNTWDWKYIICAFKF